MKITLEQAIVLFNIVSKVNLSKADAAVGKVVSWTRKLYPFNKQWNDLQADIQKEIDEARKPFAEELQNLSEEDRKKKEMEIQYRFQQKVNEIPLVKTQPEKLKEIVEVDLPLLTDDEYESIAKSFEKMADSTPLLDYLETK